ncbi:MAG TPA: carboxy-S-adenosyl-L-methionine synthase CmoA [Bacteroidetes bacterium]|nr:carboxy-S-adenosyl-L-methionine synthase CmoA [Bacteroidota bacterium]
MKTSAHDLIFATPMAKIADFTFDDQVARVFPDMIQRSVPGYSTIISMIGTLAQRFATAGSTCYDLGCSLGAATLSMRHSIEATGCRIVAVDNAPAMIERCGKIIAEDTGTVPVELICDDIANIEIADASVVVLNFTLQFIPVQERPALIRKIHSGMRDGGILILSEKIAFPDDRLHDLYIDLHHSFKKANGYSDLEIAQKRTALENVLIPETVASHRERIHAAGFTSFDLWFQCFNFASMIALK